MKKIFFKSFSFILSLTVALTAFNMSVFAKAIAPEDTTLGNSIGLEKVGNIWTYYGADKKVDKSYLGLAKNQWGWWYVKNGVIDFSYTGLGKNNYGWWHVTNGKLDLTYTGLSENKYGIWYVTKGKLDQSKSGILEDGDNLIKLEKGGKLDKDNSILLKVNGTWIYFKRGIFDRDFSGLVKNNYGWWYLTDSVIDYTYTGLSCNQYGWGYVDKGKINFNENNPCYEDLLGKWNIVNGKATFLEYKETASSKDEIIGYPGFTNSPYVSYTRISPNKDPGRFADIDTITIHCAVGQCSVEGLGNTFAPKSVEASSNYGVGFDGRIGMYVEERDRSWCSCSRKNDNRAITIEVACDETFPYAVNNTAYNALINLVTDICLRNGIGELKWKNDKALIGKIEQQNMTIHRWFAATDCPGQYLLDHMGDIADKVNKKIVDSSHGNRIIDIVF